MFTSQLKAVNWLDDWFTRSAGLETVETIANSRISRCVGVMGGLQTNVGVGTNDGETVGTPVVGTVVGRGVVGATVGSSVVGTEVGNAGVGAPVVGLLVGFCVGGCVTGTVGL